MRRVSALVASLAVAVTGCSFSSVDPNASVVVSGTALDASGKPLAETKVLLFKEADIGGVLSAASSRSLAGHVCRLLNSSTLVSASGFPEASRGAETSTAAFGSTELKEHP